MIKWDKAWRSEWAKQHETGFVLLRVCQRAKELRKAQTRAEQILWNDLRNRSLHGLKFRRQHPLGPYIVDFYCA